MTTTEDPATGISNELALGKFTDRMLADMRALIGTELRTEASVNNEYATRLAILRFAEGIGDGNPLWTDADYAAATRHGGIIAPPSFIFACLGSIQVGWPGLGGFHAETRMSFTKPIKVDDRITAKVIFDGFDGPIEQSNFGDYTVARLTDMPKVDVHIVPSGDPPKGMGEPGLPPFAPALANALRRASGKAQRELPLRFA